MEGFTPVLSSLGGMLIGLAAIGLLLTSGRIAGISGITAGVLHPEHGEALWRVLFIAGMLFGAMLIRIFHPDAMDIRIDVSNAAVLLGGFLVGIGTRIGNGCTSGHGVTGIGRLSPRSIMASLTFFGLAVLTTWLVRHVIGGL